jgi:hypothetical protein
MSARTSRCPDTRAIDATFARRQRVPVTVRDERDERDDDEDVAARPAPWPVWRRKRNG